MRRVFRGFFLLFLTVYFGFSPLSPHQARADETPEQRDFQFHGFLSQGFIYTTDNNFLVKSTLGSLDFTEAGLNFSKRLSDNTRLGMQFFLQRLGTGTSLAPKLDWGYFEYRASDLFSLRFGRVKQPVGLFNDIADIDAARAPVLLPQSVYPVQNRNYFLAQDGVELSGYTGSGSAGALDYRAYLGTIPVTITNTPGSLYQIQDVNTPFLLGGRLLWDTPLDGLRLAQSVQLLRLDTSILLGSLAAAVQLPVTVWISSIEYSHQDFLLAAEYSRWWVQSANSSNQSVFPDTNNITQGAYVMGAYRVNNWLQPALYYSLYFPNFNSQSGPENQQHDVSATLRFDINPFWLIKLEGHFMKGTAYLSSALNGGTPASALDDTWEAFLIKTTAYF